MLSPQVRGYSVLAHEAIIDTVWDDRIKPLLLQRFPGLTEAQLLEAHGAAYGGAIMADMGYYPFGDKYFSDLLHYVKAGEFVGNLMRDASTADELAFAIGVLGHYVADSLGHPMAVNRAVPMTYPKLARKFGPVMTYEDNPLAHIKVEFGFDVLQVARGNYAPKAYHDFIGFRIEEDLLAKAFRETYGLELPSILKHKELAFGTLRYSVKTLIPDATKAAWIMKKNEIQQAQPTMTERRFRYNLSRASFEKEWGKQYERPGFGARLIVFLAHLLPKIGPFRALTFRVPPPEAEKMFMSSFNATLARYREDIAHSGKAGPHLPDLNLDTGNQEAPGKYRMEDSTRAELERKLRM